MEREILKLDSQSLKLDTADFVYLPRLLLTTFFSDESEGRKISTECPSARYEAINLRGPISLKGPIKDNAPFTMSQVTSVTSFCFFNLGKSSWATIGALFVA